MIYPAKLQRGDEIRIVAPSKSLSVISDQNVAYAKDKLEEMGYRITFGRNVREMDRFGSCSIESRVEDLHEAFNDTNVKAILTAMGGYNSNQLLPHLNYELIRSNPKIFCGYSDITALLHAIYTKTGLITYSGPVFASFGMLQGLDYTIEYFGRCCSGNEAFSFTPAPRWSDDAWYLDQENRTFIPHEGWQPIQLGEAEGTLIGGNLCTLNLLQGTEFMPPLEDCILFLEDTDLVTPELFDRDLLSFLQQENFENLKGLVIGRFQQKSKMTREDLHLIIENMKKLRGIPVVADVDFGHTAPIFTFPIGGRVRLCIREGHQTIDILNY